MFLETLKSRAAAIGVELRPAQLRAFSLYSDELAAANERFNLTAIPAHRFLEEHFIDSLTLIQTGKLLPHQSCCDVGAGAGLPGLPIKIALPTIELLMIESNTKKADWLREVSSALGLDRVAVYGGRAEDAGREMDLRGSMDTALARAVAPLPVLIEYALPLLRVGGWFLAMKGPKVDREMGAAKDAATALGARIEDIVSPRGIQADRRRVIVLVRKNEPTDPKFPRKAGIPKKRPLGGRS